MGPCGDEDHRVTGPVFGVVAATRFCWEEGSWRPNRRLVPTIHSAHVLSEPAGVADENELHGREVAGCDDLE